MHLFDNTQALSEGWDLFDVDGRLALQRIDDPAADPEFFGYSEPKFASDTAAILYVAGYAIAGSAYHLQAIDLINTLSEA